METVKTQTVLARKIRFDYLESGRFTVGSKLPTISELASRYKVSAPTIARATGELANEGWLSRRRGSGIYVEALPGSQRKKIGYISVDFRSSLESHILEGINTVANRHDCDLAVVATGGDIAEERRQIQNMRNGGVKGVIVYCTMTSGRDSHDDYLATDFRDYPIVIADMYAPQMSRPYVIMDNCYAGYEITKYLLAQGRRNIAFIKSDSIFSRSISDRFTGYKKAIEDAKIAYISDYAISYDQANDMPDMKSLINTLLALNPRPDAIIAFADTLVPPIVKSLRQHGCSVPSDIVVTGFDGLHSNLVVDMWPTTKPNFVQMGECAAEMLIERIASGDMTPSGMVLPCPLLVPGVQQNTKAAEKISELSSV